MPTPSSTKSVLCSSDSRSVFSNSSRNDSCNHHTTFSTGPGLRLCSLQWTRHEDLHRVCAHLCRFQGPSQARVYGPLPRSGLSGRTCSRRPTVLSSSSSAANRSTIRRSHSRIACPHEGQKAPHPLPRSALSASNTQPRPLSLGSRHVLIWYLEPVGEIEKDGILPDVDGNLVVLCPKRRSKAEF